MSLSLDDSSASYQITGYRPGILQINKISYEKSLILSRNELIVEWAPMSFDDLTPEDLKKPLTLKPTILLLGTGAKQHFPPLTWYGDLLNQGIGVEIMDTHAACRTFNALAAENRNVVAALIIN